MKISKETLVVLRNFANINGNIWIDAGNLILTKSSANNITAEIEIDAAFTSPFGIYDLNEFLGVLALFNDPELTFTDKYVTVAEGKHKLKYFCADKTILSIPKKRMSFELVNAEPKVSFELTQEQFQKIIKTAAVLKAPDVTFVGDGSTMTAVISDASSASSNAYSFELCDSAAECSVQFKMDALKLIPANYQVVFGTNSAARFTAGSLIYHIVMEQASTL